MELGARVARVQSVGPAIDRWGRSLLLLRSRLTFHGRTQWLNLIVPRRHGANTVGLLARLNAGTLERDRCPSPTSPLDSQFNDALEIHSPACVRVRGLLPGLSAHRHSGAVSAVAGAGCGITAQQRSAECRAGRLPRRDDPGNSHRERVHPTSPQHRPDPTHVEERQPHPVSRDATDL